jgi:hypothetical protein
MKLAALISMEILTPVTKQDTSEYPAVTKKRVIILYATVE